MDLKYRNYGDASPPSRSLKVGKKPGPNKVNTRNQQENCIQVGFHVKLKISFPALHYANVIWLH